MEMIDIILIDEFEFNWEFMNRYGDSLHMIMIIYIIYLVFYFENFL